jgi:hypothetical protein
MLARPPSHGSRFTSSRLTSHVSRFSLPSAVCRLSLPSAVCGPSTAVFPLPFAVKKNPTLTSQMKKIVLILLLFIPAVASFSQKKKAVFVIVDGIPADLIEKLSTPALDSIAGNDGYKRAFVGGERNGYSETPTVSAVGYNTVLTGTWVNKHNVWGNYGKDIANPNYHYKNIFRLLKEADPSKKIAIFSSWLDNRTKLVGETLKEAGNVHFDYRYDSLEYDTVTYPNDTTSERMHHIDEAVVNKAAQTIRDHAPDLSWVYLEFTDDMGHTFGDGQQFYDAIAMMDNQMSRLSQAIQFRKKNFNEDWLIMITTDHGRDSATGKNHGGQSDRERSGWIVTNAKNLNAYYKEDSISIADIMPTIARHMNIRFAPALAREVDGTPLIGKVDATSLNATCKEGKITLTWKKKRSGKAKIWVAVTNNFKNGSRDNYRFAGEVNIDKEKAVINAGNSPDGFYKIVLETPNNTLNRWIVPAKK